MPSSSSSVLVAICFRLWNCLALTQLPSGISPYDVSAGLRINPLAEVREKAMEALSVARSQNLSLVEIEFPPLLGIKNEFVDVDNVQILNANRDWAMEACRPLTDELGDSLWVLFPDRKELELARDAWPGEAYRRATLTTIEDAATALSGEAAVTQPWGAQFSRFVESAIGSEMLGAAPAVSSTPPRVTLAVQPGDGGPVEDWINLEACQAEGATLVSVNGAFDKLRGGYYPRIFFPKLGDCIDRFIVNFESIYYLKPINDKGLSGWIYRVFPEPYVPATVQTVLQ